MFASYYGHAETVKILLALPDIGINAKDEVRTQLIVDRYYCLFTTEVI